MTSSKIYWQQREAEALKHYLTEEKEYQKRINDIYDRMIDDIQKEIDSFYARYADKEGITLAEAKKRVKTADIKEFERKAKKYVKDKNFSKQANEEMRLYNLMMKVNRLEMLKANIGLELISSFDEIDKFMESILDGRTKEELERQASILGNTIQDNAKLAHSIVNASFHNATYSDRIWMYQDLLRDEIGKQLERGLIQGKNPRVLARDLNKIFNTGKYNCERLMRTELARVQIESQKKSYEKNGFEMYTFITNTGCCDKCDAIAGKHFYVKDMIPGENAPPMHPHCRCSTAPYSDRKAFDEWLDFVSNGGTTKEWEKLKKGKKEVAKSYRENIIQERNISNRKMANGLRTSPNHLLTEDEIASLKNDAKSIGIPEEVLRFNEGSQTGFSDRHKIIYVKGDVLPDKASSNLRDILSQKAVLAHEYYGHYKNHPSSFAVGDWRDEFRASYCAAIKTPGLSDSERRMLMLDAYDRAREAGISARYNKEARRLIYGYDE